LAIRLRDIDFSVSPTKIHIRKEYAKTRISRDIYISEEATHHLEKWIDWKYRDKTTEERTKKKDPNDQVFAVYSISSKPNLRYAYLRITWNLRNYLAMQIWMNTRKECIEER
jgi:integrase